VRIEKPSKDLTDGDINVLCLLMGHCEIRRNEAGIKDGREYLV
jgi:hypothetical protein